MILMVANMEYYRAQSWEEGAAILTSYGQSAVVLAGGTDLLPAMKLHLRKPEVVIDLKTIPHEERIGEETMAKGKTIVVSPLTRLSQLATLSIMKEKYPALATAAASVGSPQLRNMGTVGGNICLNTRCLFYNQSEQWRKSRPNCFKTGGTVCHVQKRGKNCIAEFQADTVPVLMALSAQVKIISNHVERVIPLEELYSGTGHPANLLASTELIKEVRLPFPPEASSASYEKFTVREGIDFAVVSAATWLVMDKEGQECKGAKIVVSGALPSPFLCREASALLVGQQIDSERMVMAAKTAAREAKPINPTVFSVAYKRHLMEVLVLRALQKTRKNKIFGKIF